MISETTTALTDMAVNLWNGFVAVLPGLVAGLIVLIIGYILGAVLGYVVREALEKSKLFQKVLKTNFTKLAGRFDFPTFFGLIVKWYVIILFLNPVASLIKLEGLSTFFTFLGFWIPKGIIALIIGFIGFIAAEYINLKVRELKANSAVFIAPVAKIVVLLFTAMLALQQIGLDISVVSNSFLIILAGIMLALAIGFGLALKDEAKDIIKNFKKKLL
jgi:tetrahydromethanopterin S-methyltransferase subunit C